ncbi:uncharacterized protein LOC135812267 isoform X2 [Sycon ciliatum]|uniref:uncharacterized protein LOC135812267 isoform X2 n=1 Tax=Sycon ciliatum TaxID=27933 RepID=UPI0031F63CEF
MSTRRVATRSMAVRAPPAAAAPPAPPTRSMAARASPAAAAPPAPPATPAPAPGFSPGQMATLQALIATSVQAAVRAVAPAASGQAESTRRPSRPAAPANTADPRVQVEESFPTVLKGLERRQGPATTTRRGLTGQDLADLQHFLLRSNYSESDRAMIWASVLTAFHGLLRASEFLAPHATRVDSTRTLTWQQISVQASSAVVRLRVTKTAQLGDGGQVQLRETRDDFCPVRALTAYLDLAGQREATEPVFVFASGRFLTREELTKILRLALRTNEVSSHSMRIGGASLMAQRGASEWQVKRAGRWRSSACERYVRQAAGMPSL